MLSKTLLVMVSLLIFAEPAQVLGKQGDWLWALFGVILYNYLVFNLAKDELDDSRKKFSFRRYAASHWDNWVWSLLCVPVIVYFGDDIWYYVMAYFEKDWAFYPVLYLGAGVLAESLYYVLKKGKLVIQALKGKPKPTDG